MTALRFLGVFLLACMLISLLGRCFSDFDEPGENDPHDAIRAAGCCVVAIMVAGLNEMRIRRRRRERRAAVG